LINSFGTPVLSDFGIAGEMSSTGTADQIAMSLPWSAPEVVTLQTLGTVASDVWSLGATLYSLLAGRTPFEVENSAQNDNEKLKSRIVRALYTPIPRGGVPRIVEEVLNKALSRDPKNRYGSMQEFAMALNDVQRELAFMGTRLSISVKEEVGLEIEKYPCGHPKLDATGLRIGVRIDNGNRRKRKGVEEANLDECPICSGQSVIDGKKKFRKKLNPLVVLLLGAVVLGFTVTLIVLKVTGGF
jgi:serine/threonine protein kinase